MGCPVLDSEYYSSILRKGFCFLPDDNSNGTYSTATWNCCSKDSETAADGTQYTFSYNLLKQMVSKTKVGGPTTSYTYDVEGRQLSETVSGGSALVATASTYDLAGRVTSRTDAAGLVTAYAYSNGGRTVTTTWGIGVKH